MVYKILILGDYGVGKTSLYNYYKTHAPEAHEKPALKLKLLELNRRIEGEEITIHICDIPAKEFSTANKPKLYQKTVGAIILFDISRPDTFRHALFWIEELMNYNGFGKVPIALLGNKTDIRYSSERVLNPIDAKQFIYRLNRSAGKDQIESSFHEISTKEAKGLLGIFDKLIKAIIAHNVENK
ncbi:MAG: GTP-binding protein [Candidatus Heimdallarchaeota archaeon]|nr:GTP-binding protein [Candidatus Heimdallarchaeota archaeon]